MHKRISLVKNIFLSNFMRLSSPYKVTFVLTYRCNLKCQICNIWKKSRQNEVGIQEIEKIMKNFNNLGWMDLTGGEVTLRDDLMDVVRIIGKNSKKLLIMHISTNGQLPEKTFFMVQEVLKLKVVPVINISIDGPRMLNDQLRGVPGAFAKSLETFKRLKKLVKGHFYLSCTISRHNIGHIDELLEELKNEITDFTVSDIHFNLFHQSSHYYDNQDVDGSTGLDVSTVKKFLSLSKEGHPIKTFLENAYLKGVSQFISDTRQPVSCQASGATCFVDPYGGVYPCGIYNRPMGNLRDYDYDIKKLWNQRDNITLREEIVQKRCPGCWSPCEAYPAILGCVFNKNL